MFKRVLNMPLLKNKAGVRCAKRTLDAAKKCNCTWYVLKYFNDISERLTVQRKVGKFMN